MILSKLQNSGFTLLELIIASGIFASVMLLGLGIVANAEKTSRKTDAQQSVTETARFSLETIARNIRLANGDITLTADGQTKINHGSIAFLRDDGSEITSSVGSVWTQGAGIRVYSTNSTTQVKRYQTIQLVKTTKNSVSHQAVMLTDCASLTSCTTSPVALTPDDIEVTSLAFSGVDGSVKVNSASRPAFVRIIMTVELASTDRHAANGAKTTVETTVAVRNYGA